MTRRGTLAAALLLLVGLPPILTVMLLPTYVQEMQDEVDWRGRKDPLDYLERRPHGAWRLTALAELDAIQRKTGLVSRLVHSRYGEAYLAGNQVTQAAWHPDGASLLTGSASIAVRWDAATGRRAAELGPRRRLDADDPRKWGFGLAEVAWARGGTLAVGLSSGPHALWFFGEGAPDRMQIEPQGVEGLVARGQRIAFIKNLEYGRMIDLGTGDSTQLPHAEVTAIALAADGDVFTASRKHIMRWRGGIRRDSLPIDAPYNPTGFSSDARWALVIANRTVELWSSTEERRQQLVHATEVGAVCANADLVVTGTADGSVHLWDLETGVLRRSFRSSVSRIGLLACAPTRFLAVGDERSDARVWDLAGRSQSGDILRPAPPRVSFIARWGADLGLPGRMPGFTQWLVERDEDPVFFGSIGALVALLGVAWFVGRRRPD